MYVLMCVIVFAGGLVINKFFLSGEMSIEGLLGWGAVCIAVTVYVWLQMIRDKSKAANALSYVADTLMNNADTTKNKRRLKLKEDNILEEEWVSEYDLAQEKNAKKLNEAGKVRKVNEYNEKLHQRMKENNLRAAYAEKLEWCEKQKKPLMTFEEFKELWVSMRERHGYASKPAAPQAKKTKQKTKKAVWICPCGHSNASKFCVKCGKPRETT